MKMAMTLANRKAFRREAREAAEAGKSVPLAERTYRVGTLIAGSRAIVCEDTQMTVGYVRSDDGTGAGLSREDVLRYFPGFAATEGPF